MDTPETDAARIVYWHRDLPPVTADILGEHTVEAASESVEGTIAHRDELWNRCYLQLMDNVRVRLEQEVARLGGRYAHVLDEHIVSKHDDVTNRSWLHGRFNYVLYGTSAGSE